MKQNITISSEDAEFIEFAFSLVNSAKFPSFTKVTEVYNRVYNKQLSSTSCGACIRQRILELKNTLDKLNEEILKEKEIIPLAENHKNNEIKKTGGEINENGKEVEKKSEEDQGVEESEQLKEKKLKRGRPSKNNQVSAS